jgi:hypothetical protein
MWHPLTLLLCWAAFALALQWISSLLVLLVVTAISLLLAGIFAGHRSRSLLARARWLLLSLGVLFVLFTPGEYVTGIPEWLGVTHEGLARASDQLCRLLALLATLALLHERVGTQGLLTGLHALLKPFPFGDVTVVRLMLVLEHVEQKRDIGWRTWLEAGKTGAGTQRFILEMSRMRGRDFLLLGGWGLVLGAWVTWS